MTYDGQPVRQQISRYTYGEHFDSSKLRYLYMSKNWETGEFTPCRGYTPTTGSPASSKRALRGATR